jgi:hypothetical protein
MKHVDTIEPAGGISPVIASSLPKHRLMYWRARAAAALAVVIVMAGIVHADVRVSGDATAVQLHATQSNVAEVLSALATAYGLRVKTSRGLDKPVGGTFTGSLAQIVSRMLEGYNYFIRHRANEIEVTVLGQSDRAAAVARPRPPPNPAMSLSEAVRLKRQ